MVQPIEVQMGVQKVAIPDFTPNTTTLKAYEAQLTKLGFNNFKAVSAGADPTLQPNIVSGVSPSAGTSVTLTTQIIISVKNLNGTPAVTPSPSPTAKPSPSPSPTPSPYTESNAESNAKPDTESDTRSDAYSDALNWGVFVVVEYDADRRDEILRCAQDDRQCVRDDNNAHGWTGGEVAWGLGKTAHSSMMPTASGNPQRATIKAHPTTHHPRSPLRMVMGLF